MSTRSTRPKGPSASARKPAPRAKTAKAQPKKFNGKKSKKVADDAEEDYDSTQESASESASEAEYMDSDALDEDDDDFDDSEPQKGATKRKRLSVTPKKAPSRGAAMGKAYAKGKESAAQKKRKTAKESDAEESEFELDLEEGQEIVGVVVQAPKTGRVPPGQISQNTLNFLAQLKKPECNDREWFKLHEPIYRLAESEWKAFLEHFTDLLVEADPQIPHLPPKDVIHRIYRDTRFSNDKRPYKTGFAASFTRSGRKGIFAGFIPGGESLIGAGAWQPGKNELATIRSNLQRSSRRLREIISAPEFEALFGPARPHPKGAQQNIFGMQDELKVAPKGVDKTHKDIDLLKCRSFVVFHKFTDEQVLSPEFKNELLRIVKIVQPLVYCMNDLMTIQDPDSDDSDGEDGDEDEDEGDNE